MHLFCKQFLADDTKRFNTALAALRYSEGIDALTLAKQVYNIAFSKLLNISGTVSEVLSQIFSGEESENGISLSDAIVKTNVKLENLTRPFGNIEKSDLIVGDFLLFGNRDAADIFVYSGKSLISFSSGYREWNIEDALALLGGSELCTLLRPSNIIDIYRRCDAEPEEEGLSCAEQAILATAEAYILRGYRCQYDDSRFTRVGGGEFRWQIGIKNPEDYTSDRWGYINCAAFTYELYRTALGIDLGALYTTYNLMEHYSRAGFTEGEPMYPFYYEPTSSVPECERERIETEFVNMLRIGDLVVIRRSNNNGHVMLYIGGGKLVHSGGASYNYKESRETYEPTVKYLNVRDYLFSPCERNYIFADSGLIKQLGIVRPLALFSGKIPENTLCRVKNMRGIIAEKLCSAGGGKTVSSGSSLSYTFRVYNSNDKAVRVDICDKVPDNTEYLFGAEEKRGDLLSWSVALPPRSAAEVGYTVTVTANDGEVISGSGATVGGVSHAASNVYVKNTLSENESAAIIEAVKGLKEQGNVVTGFELANKIYKSAGLLTPFDISSISELEAELFVTEEFYTFKKGGRYVGMIAPGLLGGRNMQTQNLYSASCKKSSGRVRLPRVSDLVVGDVIIIRNLEKESIYLYTGGDKLLDLGTPSLEYSADSVHAILESLIGSNHYFVILRPSMSDTNASID